MVPRGVGGEFVAGLSGVVERHQHAAGGVKRVAADAAAFHAALAQLLQRAPAQFIRAHGAHHPRFRAEAGGVTGEVRGRTPEMCRVGIHVPQHFTETGDDRSRTHTMPSFFWMSSSGTPLVSGTIVLTQMSCRTIMKAKNEKT